MAESTLKSTLLDLLPDKANKARIYGSSAPRLLVSSRKTPPRHTEPRHTEPRHADIDAIVVIGDNVEIEIQDEHTEVESNTYWESGWMRFSDALPRPWETETIAGLITLTRELWPAPPAGLFRLKLIKTRQDLNDFEDEHPYSVFQTRRYCQAILGVLDGRELGPILLGPKVPFVEKDGKRPEFEKEYEAMTKMVQDPLRALKRLTPTRKKRLAEHTFEGSSALPKKKKMGGDVRNPIEID